VDPLGAPSECFACGWRQTAAVAPGCSAATRGGPASALDTGGAKGAPWACGFRPRWRHRLLSAFPLREVGMDLMRRHPVASSVVVCVVLAAALITVAFVLPLRGNVDHAAGHLSLAVPVLLLLVWALLRWPPAGAELAARIARGTLLAGLAIAGVGLVIEAVGAFGYADEFAEANQLSVLHDIGVAVWPVGLLALMAGSVMSGGVEFARRRGAAGSRIVAGSVLLALVAVVAFIAGAIIFGY
jgi:hypothetical protein